MAVFSSDMHKVSKIPMEAKSVLKFWSLTMVIHAVKSSKVMFRSNPNKTTKVAMCFEPRMHEAGC